MGRREASRGWRVTLAELQPAPWAELMLAQALKRWLRWQDRELPRLRTNKIPGLLDNVFAGAAAPTTINEECS